MRRLIAPAAAIAALLALVPTASARVLLVGTYHGIPGQFTSIQAAVDAANPDDWILIGPGDYKTTSVRAPRGGGSSSPAGVLVTKPGLYLRGMNRNTVIVDGTIVMKNGHSTLLDEELVLEQARESVRRRMARLEVAPTRYWSIPGGG